jgi:hypothetical protein
MSPNGPFGPSWLIAGLVVIGVNVLQNPAAIDGSTGFERG